MIADYLSDNDIRVTALASGKQIAHVMAHEAIDLLILDLTLPGEDGMQIAQNLRAESSIPIIILTGRKDEADRVMGLELGADDYLTKPFRRVSSSLEFVRYCAGRGSTKPSPTASPGSAPIASQAGS